MEAPMPKSVLRPPGLPEGKYPFSQLVEANGFVFVAGQVGDDPATGGLASGGIRAEVRQMLENVGARLRSVGLDYGDVVKATVFLVDMDDFAAYNEVYRKYFPVDPPTRATVGVSRLAIGARCEIEVMAAR
jgi:2-iminobutanoate/2-iminopropanoate deaminase